MLNVECSPGQKGNQRAFTMVEVAIALAIIGFALVAIIGVLPSGLTVQRENREETIINQEAAIWMNAIRSGAQGMDYLTNYVNGIEITRTPLDRNGNPTTPVIEEYYTRQGVQIDGSSRSDLVLTNGFRIVGLLTTPKYQIIRGRTSRTNLNQVTAYVRAMSGNATEKAPQDNATIRDSAFSYRLRVEVLPFTGLDDHLSNRTNLPAANYDSATYFFDFVDPQQRKVTRTLAGNLSEVRLYFRWPVRPPLDASFSPAVATNVGPNRQIYRAMAGGIVTNLPDRFVNSGNIYHFKRPGTYERPLGPQ